MTVYTVSSLFINCLKDKNARVSFTAELFFDIFEFVLSIE